MYKINEYTGEIEFENIQIQDVHYPTAWDRIVENAEEAAAENLPGDTPSHELAAKDVIWGLKCNLSTVLNKMDRYEKDLGKIRAALGQDKLNRILEIEPDSKETSMYIGQQPKRKWVSR